jgi:hypothetical protein
MTVRRSLTRRNYTDQEKRVLLSGVPLHPTSTRFGHPFHGGWNVAEIRLAWNELRDELLPVWKSDERFAHYRQRYAEPFAERFLAEQEERGREA